MIKLSILIITTPSRTEMSLALYDRVLEMIGDKDAECLLIFDNKKRSIGAKREAAKNMAQGKFFLFCDSDDILLDIEEIYAACEHDVDVIDFKAECSNADGSTFIVTQRLGNEVEHNTENGVYLDCNRPPFPNCAWNAKFKKIKYPDISFGEDWVWVEKCLKTAKTEFFIDKVLFKYNFSPTGTEASTASNEHWTNPNPVKIYARCIVNVSTDKYRRGQNRLHDSLQGRTNATILLFDSEESVGAEPHEVNNYSFKPMAMIKAYEKGHRQVLWLDASMLVIKDLEPIFASIEKDGYFFQDSGWSNKRWTTFKAREYFGTDEGPMLSSGVLGLDLDSEIGYKFFDLWTQAMRDGMFNGDWEVYRHDQSCASLIAYKLGMKLQTANTFFVYGTEGNEFILDETILLADGIS